MRISTLVILLTVFGLGGCATTLKDFERGPANQDQFERDGAACEMAAEQGRSTQGMDGLAGASEYQGSYNRTFDACMRSKGYRRSQ